LVSSNPYLIRPPSHHSFRPVRLLVAVRTIQYNLKDTAAITVRCLRHIWFIQLCGSCKSASVMRHN